jgi:hypothetical protein
MPHYRASSGHAQQQNAPGKPDLRIKSKRKIKIRKMIKSKIKSKSRKGERHPRGMVAKWPKHCPWRSQRLSKQAFVPRKVGGHRGSKVAMIVPAMRQRSTSWRSQTTPGGGVPSPGALGHRVASPGHLRLRQGQARSEKTGRSLPLVATLHFIARIARIPVQCKPAGVSAMMQSCNAPDGAAPQ